MLRTTFVLKMTGDRCVAIENVKALKAEFEQAGLENFSVWHMQQYLFGYGENGEPAKLEAAFAKLPADVELTCAPGTMRRMYHDIGIVREDKNLIRHRVFATRLKPGCEEEYKLRHDKLIEARGDAVKEGPESNFTIWYGDGHIFGYCELVKSFDHEPTPEEHAATVAWETRQLEIMDWLTDDMNWLTGENHPPVERII
jgi:L-rhamnose mutarotase